MSEATIHASTPQMPPGLSRRRLFLQGAWTVFSLLVTSALVATVRFFFPRVVPEPPARFLVGRPEEFPPGSVNTEFVERYRVWIVHREGTAPDPNLHGARLHSQGRERGDGGQDRVEAASTLWKAIGKAHERGT